MNEKMLALVQGKEDQYPKFLEANYPHVFAHLLEIWGTAAAGPYFDELMLSKRPGRVGFPPEAAAEVWTLHRIYSAQAPVKEIDDIWSTGSDDAHHTRLQSSSKDGAK